MIKFNNSDIIDWNFDDSNIIKVYHNGAIVFYKFDSEQGGYKVCYAVVDDITQYQETEFEDVYDKTTEKWYKLNNLNQYEEYGVYASGRNITTYDGKLTIDDGYEYQYSGGSWVNVGEVSGSSITIKSPEYISKTSSVSNGRLDLGYSLKDNTRFQIKVKPTYSGGGLVLGQYNATSDNNDYRIFWYSNRLYYDYGSDRKKVSQAINNTYEYEVGNYYVKNLATSANVLTGTTKSGVAASMDRKISLWDTGSTNDRAEIYYTKIYEGDTLIRDFIPWTDMNGNYGMFDKVSMSVFNSTNQLTGSSNVTDVEVSGGYDYPVYYDEKSEPLDNLTFDTLAEAQAYAEANCVYVGLKATINGDNYIFSGDSQSGYEWVYKPSRLPQGYTEVEYIQNTGTSYINTGVYLYDTTTTSYEIQCKCYFQPYGNDFEYLFGTEGTSSPYVGVTFRYYQRNIYYSSSPDNVSWTHIDNGDGTSGVTASCASTTATNGNNPLTLFCGLWSSGPWRNGRGKIYSFKVTKNNTLVRDLVPAKRDSDEKYGMYDIVNDVFYLSPNNINFVGGDPV